MKQNSSHYDGDCLQKLRDDTLHEPQSTQVAEHIADYLACRERLELLAGEPQWWSRACSGVQAILAEPQAYSSIAFDTPAANDSDKIQTSNTDLRSDESFATDFAVDFLEPNDANDTVHPHVMAIHAVATSAKLPYLVMPLIACESLQQRLDRHGPLPLPAALSHGARRARP